MTRGDPPLKWVEPPQTRTQRILCWIFARIYSRWLWGWRDGDPKLRVLKVKGWRTALVENQYKQRSSVTPCFWWLK